MSRIGKKNRANRISSAPKTRTLHSRPPLYRFQEIFHAIKTGRYPNRTKLAQTIEVTTKTIQRDIDYMRYQMSVPIEFDFARGGYYFTRPITDLPLFQLTEAELVSVFVAQKALEAYKGTAFEQPLRTAFQKLQAATGSANISVSWEDLDSAISFRRFSAYLPDATVFRSYPKQSEMKRPSNSATKRWMRRPSKSGRLSPGICVRLRTGFQGQQQNNRQL
jgi:proteasome accessory factor B